MNKFDLVLSDLDGTLVLPEAHEISERVRDSIASLEVKGINLCAVTGRTYDMAKNLLGVLGVTRPSIFCGGASIQDPRTGEMLWSQSMDAGQVEQVVKILKPYNHVRAFGTDMSIAQPTPFDEVLGTQLEVFASVRLEDTPEVLDALSIVPGIAAHANRGPGGDMSMCGIQVTHIEADKYHGTLALLKLVGVDSQHTFAIGDGDNDAPLFRIAHQSAAMGNASDFLKGIATYTVGTVHQDGFAEAMDNYVLFKDAK